MPRPAALYNRRKWQLIGKSQSCCSENCGHPLHALTYNWTRGMQLANTPLLQSTTSGLHPVSFHQMAPPVRGNTHLITAYYSVYRPRKDERLSRPGWLVTYWNKVPPLGVKPGHVTHPSTNRARRTLIRPTPLPLRHAATSVLAIKAPKRSESELMAMLCSWGGWQTRTVKGSPTSDNGWSELLFTQHVVIRGRQWRHNCYCGRQHWGGVIITTNPGWRVLGALHCWVASIDLLLNVCVLRVYEICYELVYTLVTDLIQFRLITDTSLTIGSFKLLCYY